MGSEDEKNVCECKKCGYLREGINLANDLNDLSYKDRQDVYIKHPYKYDKKMYLEDYLKRFESQEKEKVPQFVIDEVILELRKEGISEEGFKNLSENKVKKILKKIER